MTYSVQTMSYDDIVKEAKNPHVTANTLNLLLARTRELSAQKSHDAEKLQALLASIEARLAGQ